MRRVENVEKTSPTRFTFPCPAALMSTWTGHSASLRLREHEFSHPPNGPYVIRSNGTGLTLVIGGNDLKHEPDWVAARG
jgi:hypothetical protein